MLKTIGGVGENVMLKLGNQTFFVVFSIQKMVVFDIAVVISVLMLVTKRVTLDGLKEIQEGFASLIAQGPSVVVRFTGLEM